jgi:hypothetical protein
VVGDGTYLEEFEPVDRDNLSIYNEPSTVNGVTYVHSIRAYHPKGTAFIEYDLGRRYSQFQATVGLRDDGDSDARKQLEIYGDGVLLGSVEVALGRSQTIDIVVSGVLRLKIVQETLNDGFASANVVWGDAVLIR